MRKARYLAAPLVVALALVPTVAQGRSSGPHNPNAGPCRTVNLGLLVKGTLVSVGASAPHEVTLTVTGGDRHARRALDNDPSTAGFQPGKSFSFNADDLKRLTLIGYVNLTDAQAGDRVFAQGRIPYRTRRCSDGGTYDPSGAKIRHAVVKKKSS